MKKVVLGFLMVLGLTMAAVPASAQYPIIYPARPCYYQLVPVTQYQLVWTGYGYAYQAVTFYSYQLVCY